MHEPIWLRAAVVLASIAGLGADYQSPHFRVHAPTAELARKAAETAEQFRCQLAVEWLGSELPAWSAPCLLTVTPSKAASRGSTSYAFRGDTIIDCQIEVEGPEERILESVLPHEINHIVFATHFQYRLPRWADEGAAMLAEDESTQHRELLLARQLLGQRSQLRLRTLFPQYDYPKERRRFMEIYSAGFALTQYLVLQHGKDQYVNFLAGGEKFGWESAVKRNYGHNSIEELEQEWRSWLERQSVPGRETRSRWVDAGSIEVPPGTVALRASTLEE